MCGSGAKSWCTRECYESQCDMGPCCDPLSLPQPPPPQAAPYHGYAGRRVAVEQGSIHVRSGIALVDTPDFFAYEFDCRAKYPVIWGFGPTEVWVGTGDYTLYEEAEKRPTMIGIACGEGLWTMDATVSRYTVRVFGYRITDGRGTLWQPTTIYLDEKDGSE